MLLGPLEECLSGVSDEKHLFFSFNRFQIGQLFFERSLATFVQPIAQEIVEFSNSVNLLCRGVYFIDDSAEPYRLILLNYVARAAISIAWLPHTADVNHHFFIGQDVSVIHLVWTLKAKIGRKYARRMSVALEAMSWDQTEYSLNFLRIVYIFGKYVLMQRAAGRTVHIHGIPISNDPRQFAQESPATWISGVIWIFDLFSRPENRLFRTAAESVGVKQRRLIMVTQDAVIDLHDDIQTFAGVGPVADDIAQTHDFLDTLFLDVGHDRLQSSKVPVDVADNRAFHF